MASQGSGSEKAIPLAIALIVVAIFFMYLKKSGGLAEIRSSVRSITEPSAHD